MIIAAATQIAGLCAAIGLSLVSIPSIAVAQSAGDLSDPVQAEIWAREQSNYAGRASGSMDGYINSTSPHYLGWPPFAEAPFGVAGLTATKGRVSGAGERLTMALKGYSRSGDTALIYYSTHLTATADGKPTDQTYENIHVWTREAGAWRLIGGMARQAPRRGQ